MSTSENLPFPPVLPPGLVVVHVDALAAALLKLGITDVSVTMLLDATKRETLSHQQNSQIADERRKAVVKLAYRPNDTPGSFPPYKSVFVEHPDHPVSSDPMSQERRRRLRILARESKLRDPYHSLWINENNGEDRDLPSITASLVTTPLEGDSLYLPEEKFENVQCLWDTGAQISCIPSC